MLETEIDETIGFFDGAVEIGHGRAGHDDRRDALGLFKDVFTESGDLGVCINLGESEIMEIGRVKVRVRKDLNLGELESEVFERADGDDAVGRRGIMVGVGLDGETPMEPRGDKSAEKEDRITGDFGEVGSGIIDKEMVVVGGFETHDASFERALALAESLSGNATSELSG